MKEYPIQQFRLGHSYTFTEPLRAPELSRRNIIIGGEATTGEAEAFFLGKLAEAENMRTNVWIDLRGAHAIYVMGKRRSGKTFTLGCIAECLCSDQWVREGQTKAAVLVLDTMNVFLTMPYGVADIYGPDSREAKEQKRWGLEPEPFNIRLFVPRGCPRPPEGEATELTVRPCDLNAADWASLFSVDTYSDPLGQLISEVYEKVALEGYTLGDGQEVRRSDNYSIADLLNCIDRDLDVQRFENRTIEALRRRFRAVQRLPMFGPSQIEVRDMFKQGQISIVLLRDMEQELRGLLIGIIVKRIMQLRSQSDRFERIAQLYDARWRTAERQNEPDSDHLKQKSEEFASEACAGLPRGWIIIDEAHNYIPARGVVPSKAPLTKYINEGRNLGLSIVVATQQPSGLDTSIQRNADILIMHSMSMRDDIRTAEGMVNTFVPDSVVVDGRERISSRTFEQLLRSLDLGYAVVSNDRVSRVFPIKVRPRITVHGGKDY